MKTSNTFLSPSSCSRLTLFLSLFVICFVLQGCNLSLKDDLQQAAEDVRDKTTEAVDKGKEAANDVKEGALEIKKDIESKIDDIDQAMIEIGDARKAIDRIFNSSAPNIIYSCEKDEDCIVVDYEGCCTKKASIHKSNLDKYNKFPSWQKDTINCSEVECTDMSDRTTPKCLAGDTGVKRCTLTAE